MNIKAYRFAGITVKLISDTAVADSGLFDNFRLSVPAETDMEIKILHAALPEKIGEPVFSDSVSAYYVSASADYYYTFYPAAGKTRQLACRVTEKDSVTLYVVPGQELWDSLIAFAVNFSQLLTRRGIMTMHCSCIDVNGFAVLFAGDKGAGKSTQAELWRRFRGVRIINGDRMAVKCGTDGVVGHGIPFCGSSKIAENASLPVKAVILPSKAERNTICRLGKSEAFREILGKLTYDRADARQMKTALDTAEHIAENIPVFALKCLPDENAVRITEEQLCRI